MKNTLLLLTFIFSSLCSFPLSSSTAIEKEQTINETNNYAIVSIDVTNLITPIHNGDCNRIQGDIDVRVYNTSTKRAYSKSGTKSDPLISWRGNKSKDFQVRNFDQLPKNQVTFLIDKDVYDRRGYTIELYPKNLKRCHKNCDLCFDYHCDVRFKKASVNATKLKKKSNGELTSMLHMLATKNGKRDDHALSVSIAIKNKGPYVTPVVNKSPGEYYIQSAIADKYMDVKGANSANGTPLHIWPFNGTVAQKFNLEDAGGGYYYIKSNLGKYIHIQNRSDQPKALALIWEGKGNDNTKWKFIPVANGYDLIQSKKGTYLDVKWGSDKNGTPIWMWTKNAGKAQQWKLHRLRSDNETETLLNIQRSKN